MIADISTDQFTASVAQSNLPVLLDFWAPWCAPCKALTPRLEKLAKEHEGKITILKLNVDEHEDAKELFELRGFPTVIGYVGGKEVLRSVGVGPGGLAAIVNELLKGRDTEVPNSSFLADPKLKQRCLAVVTAFLEALPKQSSEAGRLQGASMGAAPATSVQPDDAYAADSDMSKEEPSPSAEICKHLGGGYAEKLGLPDYIALVHDEAFRLSLGARQGRDAIDFLNAIPVGADLSNFNQIIANALFLDQEFGLLTNLERCLQSDSEAMEVVRDVRQGFTTFKSHEEWAVAKRSLKSLAVARQYPAAQFLGELVAFCKPANELGGHDLIQLIQAVLSTHPQAVSHLWWTDSERQLMDELSAQINQIYGVAKQESRPSEEEMLTLQLKADRASDVFWERNGALKQRRDEMSVAFRRAKHECENFVCSALIETFHAQ